MMDERVSAFAGADESALFHRLYRTAIGRKRAYYVVVFQSAQGSLPSESVSS